MKTIWAAIRFTSSLTVLMIGTLLMIFLSLLPLRIGRYRLAFWMEKFTATAILFILNVGVTTADWQKIQQLHGILFPNHISYLDILVLLRVTPTRFLAKAEIRGWPVVGWAARAVGCVFVARGDKASRHQAREAVARAERFPPITIFPEGTRGPGTAVLPFRYGAFEIAAHSRIPYLPIAIVYDQIDVALWERGHNVIASYWQLCGRRGRLEATLYPLSVVQPVPADDTVQLATMAQAQVTAVLDKHQYHIDSSPIS